MFRSCSQKNARRALNQENAQFVLGFVPRPRARQQFAFVCLLESRDLAQSPFGFPEIVSDDFPNTSRAPLHFKRVAKVQFLIAPAAESGGSTAAQEAVFQKPLAGLR